MDQIIIRAEGSANLINLDEPVLTLSNQRIVMDTVNRSPEVQWFQSKVLIKLKHRFLCVTRKNVSIEVKCWKQRPRRKSVEIVLARWSECERHYKRMTMDRKSQPNLLTSFPTQLVFRPVNKNHLTSTVRAARSHLCVAHRLMMTSKVGQEGARRLAGRLIHNEDCSIRNR